MTRTGDSLTAVRPPIVASLALLVGRRIGRKSGSLPWASLAIGTAANLAANIASADHGTISRIIIGWPAIALLIVTGVVRAAAIVDREA